jgi:hypothetical protein
MNGRTNRHTPPWLALLAATLLAAAPAAAETISASDIGSVTRALAAAGYAAEVKRDDDGIAYILADQGGDEFSVSFEDCDDDVATIGCKLLVFNTAWEADTDPDVDLVNRFNRTATLARAFIDDDGAINLSLEVATRAGLPEANFDDIIAWWQSADAALTALVEADADVAPDAVVVAGLSVR